MSDPTDAEIQAGADAIARSWRPLSPTSRRHLAKLVLVDVLPDHDARVRADERARVAGEILAAAAALAGTREETTMTEQTARSHPAGLDLDAIEARNAHRRCHHCDMPLDGDQRCPNCGSETPDDVGALLAEVRRLRHQHGKVAGELADATMTMWHLEPGDRSDMPLAERITTLVAELARQRDAAAAERDRIRSEMERCVWIDPRRQSGTPCLGGTRISAYIIARLIADGTTAEQIRDMYPDVTDGHLRAVAAFMAERDTARRDGAADALELFAAEYPLCSGHHRAQLNAWAVEVRAGGRTIPTTGNEGDHHG